MAKKTLESCHSSKELISYSTKNGAWISRQNGSHVIVSTDKGSVSMPYHGNHDLPTGTRHSIIKALIALGITVIVVFYVLSYAGMV